MRNVRRCCLTLLSVLLPLSSALASPPAARSVPIVDDYYGTAVTDPYRWMESGKDPDWMPWLQGQASHARQVLDAVPGRAALLADIAARSGELSSVGSAELAGGRIFHEIRAAGEQDTKLMVREADGQVRVLLDPTTLEGDGEQVIDRWQPAPGGRHVLVALSRRGTEHSTLRVLDVATARLLPVAIPHAMGMTWGPDGAAFSYLQFVGEPGTPGYFVDNTPRLHRLGSGTPDVTLARRGEGGIEARPEQFLVVLLDPDSDTALAVVRDGRSEVAIYRAEAEAAMTGEATWTPVAGFDDVVVDFGLAGDRLFLLSKRTASGGQVLETSASTPDLGGAAVLALPGAPVIESILPTRDGLLVRTTEGAASGLWHVPEGGVASRVALPFAGQVPWVRGSAASSEVLVGMTGWFTPTAVYRVDLADGAPPRDLALVPPPPFDIAGYEARRAMATARDGTQVPYTLVMRRGTTPSAATPVLLEAYGSYGYAALPRFSARLLPMLDRGGVYAVANVRGGGEFGRDWHYAGKAATKANTWRDAIDVAEHLASTGVGSPGSMTLIGTSAGGVMLGGAVNERPELFAGAIANVGFMNPIRYVAEQNYADIEEWGGPITDAASFRTMFDLDPYQHIRDGVAYPPVLVVSGLNDPRAATFHSAKYAARLAAATTGDAPLLRIDFGAGHGMGSSRTQLDETWADIYAFALWRGGHAAFQPE